MRANSVFVSASGGVLDFVSEDGELVLAVAIPPGRVRASEYLSLCPPGCQPEISEGVALVEPRAWGERQKYGPGSHDSGANPDFRPTSATRLEKEMRFTLSRMQAATSRVEARERALARIERMPTRPAPVEPEVAVIEPEEETPNE